MLATAESCTGGLIAAAITDVPGSSAVLDRGFVTYSNDAKRDMLAVELDTLESYGAVSDEVAREMVLGAVAASRADVAVSVTGVAGPGGGTAAKPVGLVHLAVARKEGGEARVVVSRRLMLQEAFDANGRAGVREATVREGLQAVLSAVEDVRP